MTTTADKCEAILRNIVDRCNASEDGSPGKPVIKFAPDWGGNSLTLYVGDDHTHVGGAGADYPFDQLVDSLHDQLLEGRGMSFQMSVEVPRHVRSLRMVRSRRARRAGAGRGEHDRRDADARPGLRPDRSRASLRDRGPP